MDEQTRRATGTCPKCGRTLPPDAAEGLCAACLLSAGTETLSADDTPTLVSSSRPSSDGDRLRPGEIWGPYRIGRLIGRGGMGEVYEAEHLESGRRIALKVLRSRLENHDERARFLREGQLAASVSHPHTVYIFGSEEIAGTPVITMELLPGGTLKDRVSGAEMPCTARYLIAAARPGWLAPLGRTPGINVYLLHQITSLLLIAGKVTHKAKQRPLRLL